MRASVSVCLCTHNGATHLGAQLASLEVQTHLPDEVVIGDDASTDTTLDLLEQWAATASTSITIERRNVTVGHAKNLESVLGRATSDIVLICDQDDCWHPEKVQRMAAALENNPVAAGAFSDSALIDEAGERVSGSLWQTLGFSSEEQAAVASGGGLGVLLRRNVVAGHALAFKRDRLQLLLPFPDIHHADWWLAIGLLLRGGLVPMRDQLVDYRLHGANAVGLRGRASVARKIASTSPTERSKADAALLEELIRRLDCLRPGSLGEEDRTLLQAKIAHSLLRGSLPRRRSSRVGLVTKGLACGSYRRFSNGWKSALIDLMIPSR